MVLSLITDPIKSFKDQAYKIWDVKDFGERQAISRVGILLTFIYYFMFLNVGFALILVAINDLFLLAKYYTGSGQSWYLQAFEDIFYATVMLQMALFFFWTSPIVTKKAILVYKRYNKKERGLFDWTEGKIKKKYPKFKTRTQRTRERAEKTKKETRIGKWILTLPRWQRAIIRYSVSLFFIILMVTMTVVPLMSSTTIAIFTGDDNKKVNPSCVDCSIERIQVKIPQEKTPKQPDGMPPSTIFDIFISRSNTVIP